MILQGRVILCYCMIATGNHGYFDSLRDVPPSRRTTIYSMVSI